MVEMTIEDDDEGDAEDAAVQTSSDTTIKCEKGKNKNTKEGGENN
jgi:hypothetical protein